LNPSHEELESSALRTLGIISSGKPDATDRWQQQEISKGTNTTSAEASQQKGDQARGFRLTFLGYCMVGCRRPSGWN
jgi:hypothetical protein